MNSSGTPCRIQINSLFKIWSVRGPDFNIFKILIYNMNCLIYYNMWHSVSPRALGLFVRYHQCSWAAEIRWTGYPVIEAPSFPNFKLLFTLAVKCHPSLVGQNSAEASSWGWDREKEWGGRGINFVVLRRFWDCSHLTTRWNARVGFCGNAL